MSGFQRIRGVLIGLVMLIAAFAFIAYPSEDVYITIVTILALGLAIAGIRDIIFYFRMARHMIGGKMILIQGAIIFDFAILTGALASVPKIYILLYLIGIHAFSGVVEILRAMEAKNSVDGPWKMKFGHGLVNLALAALCLIFIRHSNTAIMIYSVGLIYSGIMRILNAFRRTSFILIQ